MSDSTPESTQIDPAVEQRLDRMGMRQDLEAARPETVTVSRPEASHFFAARAIRHALARIQALDLESGSPEAWEEAAKAFGEAQAMVEGVQAGKVS